VVGWCGSGRCHPFGVLVRAEYVPGAYTPGQILVPLRGLYPTTLTTPDPDVHRDRGRTSGPVTTRLLPTNYSLPAAVGLQLTLEFPKQFEGRHWRQVVKVGGLYLSDYSCGGVGEEVVLGGGLFGSFGQFGHVEAFGEVGL